MSNCASSLELRFGLAQDVLREHGDFARGTFLPPRKSPLGRFVGGVRLSGEFFKFIRNARS